MPSDPQPALPTHFKLPSGDLLPSIGLGCWLAPEAELANAVEHALQVGYRHIDGATIYQNEAAIGEGIRRSKVPREEMWVTTKLWNADHRPDDVLNACNKSLELLGLTYIDLWLMHYPCAQDGTTHQVIAVPYEDTWRVMEEAVDLGLVRNIGVSNFSKSELQKLLASCRIKPALHQLEQHPYLPQNAFVKWHKEVGIHVTAYSPLGNTNSAYDAQNHLPPIIQNEVVLQIAKQRGITPANVLISLQISSGHSVLPKSVNPKRISENFNVVHLTVEEIEAINKSCGGKRQRYCDWSEVIGYHYYADLDDSD